MLKSFLGALITAITVIFTASSSLQAGVYGDLEFGDSRETVTAKLMESQLVDQTINTSLLARTGLNGIFKCKSKLAGLEYSLFFNWDESGGLAEVTLRSEKIEISEFDKKLFKAWEQANLLFTQVYGKPVQNGNYPRPSDFKGSPIMMSHIWQSKKKESILIGPGIENEQCFLAIRFVNRRIEPVRIPPK